MPHRPIVSFSGILLAAGVLLVLAFASASAQAPDPPGDQPDSSSNFAEEDEGKSNLNAKLLAFFSTTTLTSIATTTQLKLSTCISLSAAPAACAGRRKRRILFTPKDSIAGDMDAGVQLDGSTATGLAVYDQPTDDATNRSGRKLTVWSTGYTTVTLTTTSYYQGTTVTVTALCTIAGMAASCFG